MLLTIEATGIWCRQERLLVYVADKRGYWYMVLTREATGICC